MRISITAYGLRYQDPRCPDTSWRTEYPASILGYHFWSNAHLRTYDACTLRGHASLPKCPYRVPLQYPGARVRGPGRLPGHPRRWGNVGVQNPAIRTYRQKDLSRLAVTPHHVLGPKAHYFLGSKAHSFLGFKDLVTWDLSGLNSRMTFGQRLYLLVTSY